MKQLNRTMYYQGGDLVSNDRLRVCIEVVRRMFDIPTVAEIKQGELQFVIKVSNRASKEAVRIRVHPNHAAFLQLPPQNGGSSRYDCELEMLNLSGKKWHMVTFYYNVKEKLLDMFQESGSKQLYVTISEA